MPELDTRAAGAAQTVITLVIAPMVMLWVGMIAPACSTVAEPEPMFDEAGDSMGDGYGPDGTEDDGGTGGGDDGDAGGGDDGGDSSGGDDGGGTGGGDDGGDAGGGDDDSGTGSGNETDPGTSADSTDVGGSTGETVTDSTGEPEDTGPETEGTAAGDVTSSATF